MTRELPEAILHTLETIRKTHRCKISIKPASDGFYIYEVGKSAKNATVLFYIGKVSNDGIFSGVKRRHKIPISITSIDEYLEFKNDDQKTNRFIFESIYEPKIIESLSNDGRASANDIAREIGLAVSTTSYEVKHLEQKYGIRYLIDINQSNFGFYRYIITVKFLDRMPNIEEIKNKLEKDNHVQIAAMTKGEFDLFIYILTSSVRETENLVYNLRTSEPFIRFKSKWNVTYLLMLDGILPLRDEFFELLKERVWHRTKETPRKRPDQVYHRIYATLRSLNKNGNAKFTDIDRDFGLKRGTAQYTYVHDLVDSELLLHKRVTISMQKLPIKYIAILQLEQIDMETYKNCRREWLTYTSQTTTDTPTSRFILSCDVGSPYGLLRFLPVYHEGDLECVEQEIRKILKDSVKVATTVITNTLVGTFAFNKIGKEHLSSYKVLKRDYGQDA